jgi:hypothetical protein
LHLFDSVIYSFNELIVAGFGGGLKTRIFGYFIRGDIAWCVEDGVIKPNIFYLSLSLDF